MTIYYPSYFPNPHSLARLINLTRKGATTGLTIEEGTKQELLVVQKLTAVREVAPWLSFHCNPSETVRCAFRLVTLELWCKTVKGKRHAKKACSRPDSTIAYREYM